MTMSEKLQPDWRARARERFPYGRLTGVGQWAVVRKCTGRRWKISLHKTQDLAEKAMYRLCRFGCLGVTEHFMSNLMPRKPQPPAPPKPAPVKPSLGPLFDSLA